MATVYKRPGRANWIIEYFDSSGRRRERSARTTDKRAAERIARQLETQVALERDGGADPQAARTRAQEREAIAVHVEAYLAFCTQAGQADKNVVEKKRHLRRLLDEAGVKRLVDLTPERLQANMAAMQVTKRNGQDQDGKAQWRHEPASARSRNFRRQTAVAFAQWCVKTGRLSRHNLAIVPKADERKDRRRIRRALSPEELERLLTVAREQDAALNADPKYPHGHSRREAWYLCAALAGLRRGDLARLRWEDINLEERIITVTQGKAHRVDHLPLHPVLCAALERIRDAGDPQEPRVFPKLVTDRTRTRDFQRAGIEADERGVPDLHGLRTTLGTMLARAGTAPQIAQRVLRHADIKTTMAHYTALELADAAHAIGQLPVQETTGGEHRQIHRHQAHETTPDHAAGCNIEELEWEASLAAEPAFLGQEAGLFDALRLDAEQRAKGLEPSTFSLEG